MQQENLRLNHRIAYLEDQTTELQEGLKQVRGRERGNMLTIILSSRSETLSTEPSAPLTSSR